ncbi:MAG: 16S rRNA (uracil(1498)-N(3))-methyltransferase [Bdellovibrionales bacterium]|nr:16S rRNA (uracil(1498)-N(3))-methyltransferase [Bdellovibrionales bacterium]
MRRYWIPQEFIQPDQVVISGDEYHHIFKVCRMTEGAKFELLVPGKAYFVEVLKVTKREGVAKIIEEREIEPLPNPPIHLYLAFSKWATMDNVVEKAVELGVSKITPFFSDYSFVSHPKKVSENKFERWNKIVVSATQQCGRGELMPINKAVSFENMVNQINQETSCLSLFFYEGHSQKSVKSYLQEVNSQNFREVALIVGSEGGFSDQECRYLEKHNIPSLSFGSQVLRVETACVALISIIKYEMILK